MSNSNRGWFFALLMAAVALPGARPAPSQTRVTVSAEPSGPENELKKQIAAAEAAFAAKPEDSNGLLNLAILYHQNNELQKSVLLLKLLTAQQPDDQEALLLLGLDQLHAHE